MRLRVWSLASFSGLRIRRCHELWCRLQMPLDPALLWFWRRPVATALIRPLAWEPPYATCAALERQKRQKKKTTTTTKNLKLKYSTDCYFSSKKLCVSNLHLKNIVLEFWVCKKKSSVGASFFNLLFTLSKVTQTLFYRKQCLFIEGLTSSEGPIGTNLNYSTFIFRHPKTATF